MARARLSRLGNRRAPVVGEGMLLAGDAAGLAYPESGEGIRPAVESGRLAAETLIAAGGRNSIEVSSLMPMRSSASIQPLERTPAPVRKVLAAAGRTLLRSRAFTRHVVLDRWFLRAT